MPGLMPVLGLILLVTVFQSGAFQGRADRLEAFCHATIAWAWVVALATVVLSVFEALTFPTLNVLWGALCLGLAVVAARRLKRHAACGTFDAWRDLRPGAWNPADLPLLAGVLLLLLLVSVLAFVAPTTDGDSLSYHLTRVAHWAQNRSVAPYATSNSRQIWNAPWPEYVSLHFYVLSRGDRFANLTQLLCYGGSVLLAAGLAERMGAGRRGQLLAAGFVATLPPMVSQASTAGTDVVPVFWVLCVAALTVLAQHRDRKLADWLWMGGAIGIGGIAKGTFLPYALPFVLWFGATKIRRSPFRQVVAGGIASAGVALLAWSASGIPNWLAFGSPLGSPEHVGMIGNAAFGARVTLSNMLRYAAVMAGTPIDRWNEAIYSAVASLHRLIGIGLTDPLSTFPNMGFGVGWLWPGDHSDPCTWA